MSRKTKFQPGQSQQSFQHSGPALIPDISGECQMVALLPFRFIAPDLRVRRERQMATATPASLETELVVLKLGLEYPPPTLVQCLTDLQICWFSWTLLVVSKINQPVSNLLKGSELKSKTPPLSTQRKNVSLSAKRWASTNPVSSRILPSRPKALMARSM